MEPVQRLIIGNNVYDANDDELESEVTPYLDNLVQKQKTAKDGKDAIITATQNRTGKPITTNTYAEVVDKINAITMRNLKIPNLLFRSKFSNYASGHCQEIIDNKKVRFSNWDSGITGVGDIAFFSKYTRNVLHIPITTNVAITLSIQVNLDFSNASADLTPIFSVRSEEEPTLYNISIAKVDNTTIKVQYATATMGRAYDTITVPDISNFNYFGVDIICLEDRRIQVAMFGGTRQASETSDNGFMPASKVRLFVRTYTSKFASYVLTADEPIEVLACGNDYSMDDAKTFVKTALYLHDFGVRLTDEYKTSVVGNTTFLDMEVTS